MEDEDSLLVLEKIEEEGTTVAVGSSLLLLTTIDEHWTICACHSNMSSTGNIVGQSKTEGY